MLKRASPMLDIFLQPGEYFVGDATYRVRTLLGSCVSITLWHPGMRVGAMSHFILASGGRRRGASLDGRYGEDALVLMLGELKRAGVAAEQCHAKIFGGGDMFPGQVKKDVLRIGDRNGEEARALLRRHNIKVVSESLFGVGHRQIVFDVSTGHVWGRQVRPIGSEARNDRK
ncbi:chemotaxis protein CheD [Noviherbaspirillum autotrophicum]|uniref:Probable chemoreceptor glutamine deamidase CheD n=2 Tax=Noviherbaspirillum autotrophicum TaxID=709839 RepID=A0A0C2BMK8_9BURK|nr:chemotaxis protein CheD [Noviherbaspirillum autotrophicum]